VPETAQTGRTTEIASRSPNLAERLAPSSLKYGTARLGSHAPERQNRPFRGPHAKHVEPGLLLDTRTGPRLSRFLPAASPQPTHPRTSLPCAPTVLFRSGPEINS